ncbi:MAG: hypothetical protein NZ926_00905 [Candidatus Methanomethylicia archaeon]|nr:hypothetical protein [Candidatus Methanomethylicia archaeon]MCX8168991.1 hypothetical protein [Candidatus Methanomethylicia archaeon]MDW7988722.1 hypothetical protein [Nitrososphaerota archaeon]
MSNYGFSRIIELLLAIIIISSSMNILVLLHYSTNGDDANLYDIVFNTLYVLEENGDLSYLVYSGNWPLLVKYIKNVLPNNLNFRVIVYDEQYHMIFSYGVQPNSFIRLVSIPFTLWFRGMVRIIVLQVWK